MQKQLQINMAQISTFVWLPFFSYSFKYNCSYKYRNNYNYKYKSKYKYMFMIWSVANIHLCLGPFLIQLFIQIQLQIQIKILIYDFGVDQISTFVWVPFSGSSPPVEANPTPSLFSENENVQKDKRFRFCPIFGAFLSKSCGRGLKPLI